MAHIYHVAQYVSSIGHLRSSSCYVTLRRVQRGVDISGVLPALLKARGWTQKRLGDETGIGREDVNAICNGKTVGEKRLGRIAMALRMEADDIRAAASTEEDDPPSDLDRLLVEVEESDTGPLVLVATALRLLTRRLELVERQLARGVQQASEA